MFGSMYVYLNLLADFQNTPQDTSTGYTSFEIMDLATRLVHIETSDNDQMGLGREVSNRYWDLLGYVFTENLKRKIYYRSSFRKRQNMS